MEYILFFLISLVLSVGVFNMIYHMLKTADFTETNYRNEKIPIGMGLLFVIISPILIILIGKYMSLEYESFVISFGIVSMGLMGLMDDFLGTKDDKGFKGHIKALLKGRLTTGGLKAVSGFGIAFLISLSIDGLLVNGESTGILSSFGIAENSDMLLNLGSVFNIILNTFMIALFTNIINLFDLRPGRACKAYLFLMAISLIFASTDAYYYIYVILFGVILGYIRKDLKALVMLGDTGSNAMGVSLGVVTAMSAPASFRIMMTVILIVLHLVSEFYSFTKIIEKVKPLKFLDQLGRD